MLKSVIENYLTSIREVEFFGPFKSLLEGLGYHDIHLLHGPTEFGKDFIAQKDNGSQKIQYCFQIKVGDINLNKFMNEIKPQLLEIITNSISHPNFDNSLKLEIIFVTTGILKPPTTISFQKFNDFIKSKFEFAPILTWEKDKITSDFCKIGIEPFYELHNSPEFAGRFFSLYSKIKNAEQLTPFDITAYTDSWFDLDFGNNVNKLQIWFEGYFFSKLLFENKCYYESVLFICALCRVLIKNKAYDLNSKLLVASIKENINAFCSFLENNIVTNKESYLFGDSFFSIFTYPITCTKSLEMLSLRAILFDDIEEKHLELFDILLKEKGSYRCISDNYAVSVFLVSQTLLKYGKLTELKKYIHNCAIWLCDRYEVNGLSPIGYRPDEEYEQIISEYLSGLEYHSRKTSFIASVILDICVYLGDHDLYASISNEFRAVEIILEYFHVNSEHNLFDYSKVITQTDHEYKLELDRHFAKYVQTRNESFNIVNKKDELMILSFLLRDRYFPEVFMKN